MNWILVLLAFSGYADDLDVQTIIERSVAANKRDWKEAPSFSYLEKDREASGTKTYEVSMILGSPYRRLVAINDEPLPQANQRKQQNQEEQAIERRRAESEPARAKRIAEYENERRRDQLLMEQLTVAFNFKLVGEEKIDSRDTYVLEATPKVGYSPPNLETEVLTGMQGTLWIDTATFQWARVEAQVVRPVSIVGFIAKIEPGTRFELEQKPVAEGIWLPSHFAMQSRARIFHVVKHSGQEDETYSNYHRDAGVGN